MTTPLTKTQKTKKKNYLVEVQKELKKVNWTSREDLKVATKVVLVSVVSFGLAIYGVDLIIRSGLDTISWVVRWLGG